MTNYYKRPIDNHYDHSWNNKEPIQSTLFSNKTKESILWAGSSISSLWLDPERWFLGFSFLISFTCHPWYNLPSKHHHCSSFCKEIVLRFDYWSFRQLQWWLSVSTLKSKPLILNHVMCCLSYLLVLLRQCYNVIGPLLLVEPQYYYLWRNNATCVAICHDCWFLPVKP